MEAKRFFKNLKGPRTPHDIDLPTDAALPTSQAKEGTQVESWEAEGGNVS